MLDEVSPSSEGSAAQLFLSVPVLPVLPLWPCCCPNSHDNYPQHAMPEGNVHVLKIAYTRNVFKMVGYLREGEEVKEERRAKLLGHGNRNAQEKNACRRTNKYSRAAMLQKRAEGRVMSPSVQHHNNNTPHHCSTSCPPVLRLSCPKSACSVLPVSCPCRRIQMA